MLTKLMYCFSCYLAFVMWKIFEMRHWYYYRSKLRYMELTDAKIWISQNASLRWVFANQITNCFTVLLLSLKYSTVSWSYIARPYFQLKHIICDLIRGLLRLYKYQCYGYTWYYVYCTCYTNMYIAMECMSYMETVFCVYHEYHHVLDTPIGPSSIRERGSENYGFQLYAL